MTRFTLPFDNTASMRLVGTCDRFWEEKVPYTPESRVRVHEHLKAKREKEEKKEFVAL